MSSRPPHRFRPSDDPRIVLIAKPRGLTKTRAPHPPLTPQELTEKSLWVFRKENPVRRSCVSLIRNPWFDRVVMTLILLNCVFLAMDSREPGFEETTRGCVTRPPQRPTPTDALKFFVNVDEIQHSSSSVAPSPG